MPTEDYMNDEMDDLHARVRELEDELHVLEKENDDLSNRNAELTEKGSETCSFCRQPQADWPTLLAHYDTCTEIQRTRLML